MEVDYRAMKAKAIEIRELGTSLNGEFSAAWESVNGLRATWYGVRYNTLISFFNKTTDAVNGILTLVVCTIPEQLGTIAKNYSIVDGDPISIVEPGPITPIEKLVDSSPARMAFDQGTAESVKNGVIANFGSAIDYMEKILNTFNSVDWVSEARNNYQAKLVGLKGEIVGAIETIKSQFTTTMEEAATDMQNAENANNVGQ